MTKKKKQQLKIAYVNSFWSVKAT